MGGYSRSFLMGITDIMVLYRKELKALPWSATKEAGSEHPGHVLP